MRTLDDLNAAPDLAAALDGVFEHAAWVAERTAPRRPFPTVAALHDAMMATVRSAPAAEITAFLNAHPELAADKLPAGLTEASATEQAGLGMARAEGAEALPALNRAYRERFGIPFIVCVARHTGEDVLRSLRRRLGRDAAAERAAALEEIGHISRLRLLARITGPGLPRLDGHLSTHVLDVGSGQPGAGLAITLLQEGRRIANGVTDADGRLNALLPPGPLREGRYEMRFDAGAYFARRGIDTFYDTIPVAFRITQAEGRYHIPLLLAPFSYTTYRGS